MPIISFIIAAYNAEKYIKQCIESCLNCPIENKEIIFINDGSTDKTLEICKKIQLEQPILKIINQPNKGVSSARNAGINLATGDWLLFIDADDTINSKPLMKILSSNMVKSKRIELCTFGCNFIFKTRNEVHNVKNSIYNTKEFLNSALFQLASWNYLFNRNLIMSHHIRFPEGVICTEDQNFNIKALCCCKQIASFNQIVYNYNCTNSHSASQKKHSADWIKSRLESANDILLFCKQHAISPTLVHNQIKRLYESYMLDTTTEITLHQKKSFFIEKYRLTISMLPSFKKIWKFQICYQNFTIGLLMFYLHKKIHK